MISNTEGTTVLSALGWVDQDAVWRFDAVSGSIDTVPLGTGARYLSLHSTGADRFSVAHHFDGGRFEVTAHSFFDFPDVLACAVVGPHRNELSGDARAWDGVPLVYVEYLCFEPWKDYVLLKVEPSTNRVEVQGLPWYDDRYDKGYQGVVDVLELPDEGMALVSVQRSSRLILHGLATGTQKGTLDLGGRGGNPKLYLAKGGTSIWASDYDTLVRIERNPLKVVRTAHLQGAFAGTQQFIGDFYLSRDEELCVVARPFSGDVVALDAATLKVRSSAKLGRQPLDVALLPDARVVSRDWKTGDLLQGTLKRRRWFLG